MPAWSTVSEASAPGAGGGRADSFIDLAISHESSLGSGPSSRASPPGPLGSQDDTTSGVTQSNPAGPVSLASLEALIQKDAQLRRLEMSSVVRLLAIVHWSA